MIINTSIFYSHSTPYRPPSQSLKLSSSTAAFCNSASRMSPQHHNATMPDVSLKTESKAIMLNNTIHVSNDISHTSENKGNKSKVNEPKETNSLKPEEPELVENKEVSSDSRKITDHQKSGLKSADFGVMIL